MSATTPAESILLRVAFLEEDPGDRIDAIGAGVEHRLDQARLALDVVVEEDHRVGRAFADGAVDRRAEPEVLLHLEHLDLLEALPDELDRAVGGPVVDEDDVDRPGLAAQALERPRQELLGVEARDVDGGPQGLSHVRRS